jgi:hypothetical protein
VTAAVERWERTGIAPVDLAVIRWGQANLCPTSYRIGQKDDGATDWPNLLIGAISCHALDIDPIRNLPDTYVVHGRFGMMAALQIALAQRDGIDLQIVSADATAATVRIVRPHDPPEGHLMTVTMKEAETAGWAGRNPCYKSMPRQMLTCRGFTSIVAAYAPGVLRGISSRLAPVGVALDDDGAPLAVGGGGASHTPPEYPPPPAAYMTQEAPEALRAKVLERLRQLEGRDPAAYAELRAEWKRLRGPVIQVAPGAPRPVLLPDLAVLYYMLDETEGALAVAPSGVAVPEGDPTATYAHDDAPESRGMEPDDDYAQDYDPDDPGRPF